MHFGFLNNIIVFVKTKTKEEIILKEKSTIFIADDNTEFVSALVAFLNEEEDFEVVGTANDGRTAIEEIQS